MRLILAGALALLLAACASGLTDKQQAYDVLSKYEAVQVVVERVVTDPRTPDDIKNKVKDLNEVAFQAVTRYSKAKFEGQGTADMLHSALTALVELTTYMVDRGYFTEASLDTDRGFIRPQLGVA